MTLPLFDIGDISVARIEEVAGPWFEPRRLIPDWDDAALTPHRHWLESGHLDPASGFLCVSFHSWLLRTRNRTILVDTCCGNDKERPAVERFHRKQRPWLERLAAAGVAPEQVDLVMCTHLHIDHVGWNTRLENGRWVPTFPNARYLFSRADRQYWDPATGLRTMDALNDGVFNDSVLPVIEAGQADLVDGIAELADGMMMHPAPGHTPGNMILKTASRGVSGIFAGDCIHHPMQAYRPDWNASVDEDPALAHRTRVALLEECAERHSLLLPGHFAAPHAAYVRRDGDGFALELPR